MDESQPRPRTAVRQIAAIVLVVYWVGMFVGTHIPLPTNAFPPNVSDKSLHLLAYAGLAFLLAVWRSLTRPVYRRELLILLAVAAGYGVLDELLQIPVGRHADIRDWAADLIGAAVGLSVFTLAAWFLRARQQPLEASETRNL